MKVGMPLLKSLQEKQDPDGLLEVVTGITLDVNKWKWKYNKFDKKWIFGIILFFWKSLTPHHSIRTDVLLSTDSMQ